jgi:hypothetical protein
MNRLVDYFQRALGEAGLPTFSQTELLKALRSAKIYDYTKAEPAIDVSEQLWSAKKNLWEDIQSDLFASIANSHEYSLIIATGGGGAFMIEFLQEHFGKHRVVLSSTDPMMANCIGFMRYGKFKSGQ